MHPRYCPRTKLEERLFPFLGRARIIGGPNHHGEEGTIISLDDKCARIAFDNFWDREDGDAAVEANDSGWYFTGEYEIL